MRVVVYAEGVAELYGVLALPRTPTSAIPPAEWGAAHSLVRRTIDRCSPSPARTIQFEETLNLPSARPPRGSDLLDRKNLRRLLSWPEASRRPDLAVLLIDQDGDESRHSTVESYVEPDWRPPVAIGVAVKEFEIWLIGDMQAVREVLAISIEQPRDPESMKPGRAKEMLADWVA